VLKGAIHIHSTYSDGEFTLAELREIYRSAGCSFICMTDHAESFDDESLARYLRECGELSDESFIFIAGLEYQCFQRMHVLGLGMTSQVGTQDPEEVIRRIRSAGGVSVIAHPMDKAFEWIEGFQVLPNGIETWNSKYDGRYAPRPATFRMVQRLRRRTRKLHAFYGQDLHWKMQYRGLFNIVDCHSLDQADVLAALAQGKYHATKDEWTLPSNADVGDSLMGDFQRLHSHSDQLRKVLKSAKTISAKLGLVAPQKLKARLRWLF
jgi:predicted metal-dependent phosphoesterase TrpH